MSDFKTVLVTGSSSGLGRLTAETLAAKGHRVFASMRAVSGNNAEPARSLRAWAESTGARLHVIELDVTSDASVERAVQDILATAAHIDVVVNNAATGSLGLLEGYTPAQLASLFDVNVMGVQRVNRALLPHMRERRSGLLVHVSSMGGRIVLPAMAPYCATKFALEALAESYRYELCDTGVDAVIVQLGGYLTDFMAKTVAPAEPERLQDYGVAAGLPQLLLAGVDGMKSMPAPPDSQEVADAITALIEMPAGTRPLRTVVDRMMGQLPTAINEVAERVTASTLEMLGMGAVLGPKR